MKYKKALIRSAVIVAILALSVAIGLIYQAVWDKIDRSRYPQSYSEFVTKYSAEYSVPEYIIYSVIKTESGFDSSAKSSAGAVGLMQIMPKTFDSLCQKRGESYEAGMLYDPETSIHYGTFYLSELYYKYEEWDTVFAAYNAGETKVDEWIAEGRVFADGKLRNIPYEETENYVKKVNGAIKMYRRLYYDIQ